MSLIKIEKLLVKYNEMWDKFSNSIKNGSDSEPVYSKKCVRTKIKFYEGKSTQIFMVIRYQKKVLNKFIY